MEYVLDNPIYHALTSGHKHLAKGVETVKYYTEDVTAFAGLKNNSQENLNTLYRISPAESLFVFFAKTPVEIPEQWKLLTHIDMYQFIFRGVKVPDTDGAELTDLDQEHVAEMIDLVELTKPGPFLSKTIELSNYTGIFVDGKLASMAGHRFFPSPYREVSAVCTHPDHLGKGYSFKILKEQIKRILLRNEIPFLHVRNDNEAAIKLYQKLDFEIRTDMIAYVIKKEAL
ncbi:GNAT family N-acetyltransferase [Pedobacter sp. D749]|uniref:GNAT family N-acetyltransferase n=1 Tax=Pedobacter sp. D749 TaxID=2856523 RepID=UPI001C593C06|nr:GNAT family N-acetyltransferase [Pedobacter sp. D749]QXU40948.1 GNAT family N-acetyltransferase [Pedobacter sp. D749]